MKTTTLVCIAIFALSTAQAQDENEKSNLFDFGLRHGYSLHNRYFENNVSNTDTEIYLGAFAEWNWSERFSLRLESTYNIGSIFEIALLSKYKISDKWEFYTGPQLDLSFTESFSDAYRNKTVGASFVLGTQYNINQKWFLDARYTYGLTKQFQLANDPVTPPAFGKRDTITLGVGYKF